MVRPLPTPEGAPLRPDLHSEVGDDSPLVALQGLQGDVGDLPLALPHEHLARRRQHLLVLTLDLHLRVDEKKSRHQ